VRDECDNGRVLSGCGDVKRGDYEQPDDCKGYLFHVVPLVG
jgi:hypothetical protein